MLERRAQAALWQSSTNTMLETLSKHFTEDKRSKLMLFLVPSIHLKNSAYSSSVRHSTIENTDLKLCDLS